MKPESAATPDILSPEDQNELTKLINVLELSEGAATIFAIAPDCSAKHPVVERLKLLLADIDESFQLQNFFYSERDFYTFLHSLDRADTPHPKADRRLVMAFGLDQLDLPRLKREMKQLNLGREVIFEHNLVLIFWLNRIDFLDEFRRRAPDFWDWRGKVAIFKTHPPIDPLLYPYLEGLIAENSYLKMSGIMQVQRQVDLFLDQIYVSLQAERRQEVTETVNVQREHSVELALQAGKVSGPGPDADDFDQPSYSKLSQMSADIAVSTKTVTERVDLADAIRRNQYSVILGDPGAGKTTLLRYLALHFAQALRQEDGMVRGGEAEELGPPLLPVFFRIAEYSEQLVQQPELSLLEFLGQFYQQFQAEGASNENGVQNLLCEKLRQGRCLVLLDGLDEVFDQASRKLIVERIEEFVNTHSANKFVITSRIAGYKDANLSSRFAHFTITAMSSEQVEKFLARWCLAIEQAQQPDNQPEFIQQRAEDETQGILNAIKDNEGVKRLTTNPLLLTILALIHRNGERLPNRRVKLYELAVQTLTEDWQLHRGLPETVILTEGEVVEMLAPLAYWMHETKPSGLVEQAEVEEKLAETLAELTGEDPESSSVQQAVAQFLRKVRETTGLFVERAPGVYGFMHLTFEEYFAARHIADNDPKEVLRIIRDHLHEPRWEEPILLTLGYYGIHFSGQANRLVQQLFSDLEDYRPAIDQGEIQLRNAEANKPVLVWPELAEDGTVSIKQSDTVLKELMLAGRVMSEVTVSASTRLGLIKKLILTSLGTDEDIGNDTIKNLLRTLRQIEQFNQKGEVVAQLKQFSSNLTLSEEIRAQAKAAILYVICGDPGEILVKHALEILN
ncbi:MAG: NACHT domain-containing protein, partial [Pseudanabaenales cyanobacterium]|nr:NACHT domain-containing protein [Pseudanabaenales cyanobacterium]